MMRKESLIVIVALGCLVAGQTTLPSTTTNPSTVKSSTATATSPSTSTQKPTVTTTLSPEESCAKHNGSCKECVNDAKCLFCYTDNSCIVYPVGKILPDNCDLSKARWGVCWVNFEALIISVSVIGGVILISFACCIYCCCCRNKSKKYDKDDSRFEQQKMDRKVKQDERRSERKNRLDEIRRKYGLVKDDAPYQRFDNA